jgi:transcriptional regulator, GntR family
MEVIDMIDRTSHVPLYIQLKEIIKKQIETNNLQPGEAIPSERELSEKYN